MSDGTGYVMAAYLITLVALLGYAVALVAKSRATARRLDQARAQSHGSPAGATSGEGNPEAVGKAAHV